MSPYAPEICLTTSVDFGGESQSIALFEGARKDSRGEIAVGAFLRAEGVRKVDAGHSSDCSRVRLDRAKWLGLWRLGRGMGPFRHFSFAGFRGLAGGCPRLQVARLASGGSVGGGADDGRKGNRRVGGVRLPCAPTAGPCFVRPKRTARERDTFGLARLHTGFLFGGRPLKEAQHEERRFGQLSTKGYLWRRYAPS
jgi:hypothetical protein